MSYHNTSSYSSTGQPNGRNVALSNGQSVIIHEPNSDDEYFDLIKPYEGSEWYDTLKNNPYLISNNQPFSPTLLQSLGELFGDTSAHDAYYQNLLSQRNAYYANILEQIRQQNRNEPANQVALEKAAGVNTDLGNALGTGTAVENDQPAQPVSMPVGDTESELQFIGSTALSFAQMMFGFAQGVQGMQANSLSMVGQEIANNNAAMDFVIQSMANSGMFKSADEIDNMSDEDFGNLLLNASSKIDLRHYSRRTQKVLRSAFGLYGKRNGKDSLGLAAVKSKLRNVVAQNADSAARSAGSVYFDEDFSKMLSNVIERFSKLENEVYIAGLNASKSSYGEKMAENAYNSRYFHHANDIGLAEQSAEAELKSYSSEEQQKEFEEKVNQMWNDVAKIVQGDKWYNVLGMIAVSYLRSQSFHLPSLHYSGPKSTTNINNTSNNAEKVNYIRN